jgi:hypothetical protein
MPQGIAFFVSGIAFPAACDVHACVTSSHAHTPRYRQSEAFARIIAA